MVTLIKSADSPYGISAFGVDHAISKASTASAINDIDPKQVRAFADEIGSSVSHRAPKAAKAIVDETGKQIGRVLSRNKGKIALAGGAGAGVLGAYKYADIRQRDNHHKELLNAINKPNKSDQRAIKPLRKKKVSKSMFGNVGRIIGIGPKGKMVNPKKLPSKNNIQNTYNSRLRQASDSAISSRWARQQAARRELHHMANPNKKVEPTFGSPAPKKNNF